MLSDNIYVNGNKVFHYKKEGGSSPCITDAGNLEPFPFKFKQSDKPKNYGFSSL